MSALRRGALAAALLAGAPATFAASPSASLAASAQVQALPASAAVAAFYDARQDKPLWFRSGASTEAARQLVEILRRARVEGMASGPVLANAAEAAMARASSGDPQAMAEAERLLSAAWVQYVQTIRRPSPLMEYGDAWLKPQAPDARLLLAEAASAPSLADYMASVSKVNPIYAQLRDAAWQQTAQTGEVDGRIVANLQRARFLPPTGRYVLVDAGAARLYMVDNRQIQDSMKVIVGKPQTRTPMVASTIYYATLNPYWHVPADLARRIIAPGVLEGGTAYLRKRGYEVVNNFADAQALDPAKVDWKAVAAGRSTVNVRQKPGPTNSMGRVKFHFANSAGVYLHDTPQKELFDEAQRTLSNGCIRLEDARRLSRWLMGRDLSIDPSEAEQHVQLAQGVPIFVTYLTAQADGGSLAFSRDVYGYDRAGGAIAAAQ